MDNPRPKPTSEMQLNCEVCLKEIPESAALNTEGADYVGAFCGLECYQIFRAHEAAEAAHERELHEPVERNDEEAEQSISEDNLR